MLLKDTKLKYMTPKETIAYYNKIYLVDYMTTQGFRFNEKTLEYTRKTNDFKQVIFHRCSRTNMSGHLIDFEQGYYNLSNRFKTWYKKTYGVDPVGGIVIIGAENKFIDNWNPKYQTHIGTISYDLINEDIKDQFKVLLENIKNVMIPFLDRYKDFDTIINNPNKYSRPGLFDSLAHIRCIEYCIFKNEIDRAHQLAEELKKLNDMFINTELERIFN